MRFDPSVGNTIKIDDTTFGFMAHPVAPDIVYAQEGRQGTVYKLAYDSSYYALKVFHGAFRTRDIVTRAEKLTSYTQIPGLLACRRTVLTPARHAELLAQFPELNFAVLMPWIDGPTWFEIVFARREITQDQSRILANALIDTLSLMEQNSLALALC